ncbi:sigma-70 family RNA polymerase sigma factor [bacterium]|nr:sigma-70 family RNA polymerase sigma factor [bacterium]
MKQYNTSNYRRYKADLKASQPEGKFWDEYTRDELIIKFLPLVENIARKFSTSDSASGVMNVSDMISMGQIGLIQAVDKINWPTVTESDDPEKTIKSYLAKRVRGAIRRGTDANRSPMRIPEHKLNDIRKGFEDDLDKQAMFYNSMFQSIDEEVDDNMMPQYEDESDDPLKKEKLYQQLNKLMLKHLTDKEYNVVRLSYGLGCDKMSAKQIADKLDIKGSSSYVRVSQLKKQAIDKLKSYVNHSQVVDYL